MKKLDFLMYFILFFIKYSFAILYPDTRNLIIIPDAYKKLNSVVSLETGFSNGFEANPTKKLCSGIIIDLYTVLTSKHCLQSLEREEVLEGNIPSITRLHIVGHYKIVKKSKVDYQITNSHVSIQQIYISSLGETTNDDLLDSINNDWILLKFDTHLGASLIHSEIVDLFDSKIMFPEEDIIKTAKDFYQYLSEDPDTVDKHSYILKKHYKIVIISVSHGKSISWKSMRVDNPNNKVFFNKDLNMLSWSENDQHNSIVTEKSDSGSPVFICEDSSLDQLYPKCKLISIVKGSVTADGETYAITTPVYKMFKSIDEEPLTCENTAQIKNNEPFVVENVVTNSNFLVTFIVKKNGDKSINPVRTIEDSGIKFMIYNGKVSAFLKGKDKNEHDVLQKVKLKVKLVCATREGHSLTKEFNANYFNIYPENAEDSDMLKIDNSYVSLGKLFVGQSASSFIGYTNNTNLLFSAGVSNIVDRIKIGERLKLGLMGVKQKIEGLFAKKEKKSATSEE